MEQCVCSGCIKGLQKQYKDTLGTEYIEYLEEFKRNRYSKNRQKRYDTGVRVLRLLLRETKCGSFTTFGFSKINKECQKCDDIIKRKYIRSLHITTIMEFLVEYNFLNIMKQSNTGSRTYKFANAVRKKMIEFSQDEKPINDEWKGYDYYYLRIFNYSHFLKGMIPDKLNYLRNQLREEIYCHPLASHGFRYENWEEIAEFCM